MVIGLLEAKFSLPEAFNLKDKRRIIKSMKDRLVGKMNVSVAEVGKQDFWKSAEFAFVTVAAERKIAEKRLAEISTFIRTDPRMILLDFSIAYI